MDGVQLFALQVVENKRDQGQQIQHGGNDGHNGPKQETGIQLAALRQHHILVHLLQSDHRDQRCGHGGGQRAGELTDESEQGERGAFAALLGFPFHIVHRVADHFGGNHHFYAAYGGVKHAPHHHQRHDHPGITIPVGADQEDGAGYHSLDDHRANDDLLGGPAPFQRRNKGIGQKSGNRAGNTRHNGQTGAAQGKEIKILGKGVCNALHRAQHIGAYDQQQRLVLYQALKAVGDFWLLALLHHPFFGAQPGQGEQTHTECAGHNAQDKEQLPHIHADLAALLQVNEDGDNRTHQAADGTGDQTGRGNDPAAILRVRRDGCRHSPKGNITNGVKELPNKIGDTHVDDLGGGRLHPAQKLRAAEKENGGDTQRNGYK